MLSDIIIFKMRTRRSWHRRRWACAVMRCYQVYNNTFYWTVASMVAIPIVLAAVIWHDNTFLGRNSGNGAHTALPYFRQLGAISNDLSNWGHGGWCKRMG